VSELDASVAAAEMLTALPEDTLQDAINVLQGSANGQITMAGYIVANRRELPNWEQRAAKRRTKADQRVAVARVLQAELDGRGTDHCALCVERGIWTH
jgi:hypothetical protein